MDSSVGHIEFFGPPGAGKSTILSRMISSDRFYGGTEEDAVRRVFLEEAERKHQLLYRVTPAIIRRFIEDELIKYRLANQALEDFIRTHPDFINYLSVIMNSISYEPEKIFSFCKRSAEKYQLGVSTVSKREILCLDECFAQRAFAILWREPDEAFSLERYFEIVPTPEVVIYVDAPSGVCLERQRKRGRVAVAQDWKDHDPEQAQNKSRKLCLEIKKYLMSETSVITVGNTGTVESAVEKISSEISKSERKDPES